MTKIIGVKDLQTRTKYIREEVEKGIRFIVVWRSKPIFEIKALESLDFADTFHESGIYTDDFLQRMNEAEENIRTGKTKKFKSAATFLQSLK